MTTLSDPKRPVLDHFLELGLRLKRCLIYFVIACAIGYVLNSELVRWILGPLKEQLPKNAALVYTKPFEKIWVYIRVSIYFGFLFASPLCLLEAFHFVNPAFKKRVNTHFFWLLLASTMAFSIGIYTGKEFALPAILRAVFSFGSDDVLPFLTLSSYVNSAAGILLACAIFCEIPIIMFFLGLWGFVSVETWRKGRRLAIVANAILSAFLSPPDPLSMLVLMVPIFFIYEGGVLLAALGCRLSGKARANDIVSN